MNKLDFEVALTLLRDGNSDMMRKLYPDLELVFDLIDGLRGDYDEFKEHANYLGVRE